jgi:uncharacterized BrkB/YihY/UPF0761 family membrane protein
VYWKAGTFRSRIHPICEGLETMLDAGEKLAFYSVTVCFPAILLALIVIGIYLKERSKKL